MTKRKRPTDINQLATAIVQESTSDEPVEEQQETPQAEAERKGGENGGKARAEKLTPEERQEIAKIAANARWSRKTEDR